MLEDGEIIYYDEGSFDKWCVFLKKQGNTMPPRDYDYFTEMKRLSEKYASK